MAQAFKPDFERYRRHHHGDQSGLRQDPATDKNTFPMPFLIGVDEAVDHIVQGHREQAVRDRFPLADVACGMRLLASAARAAASSRSPGACCPRRPASRRPWSRPALRRLAVPERRHALEPELQRLPVDRRRDLQRHQRIGEQRPQQRRDRSARCRLPAKLALSSSPCGIGLVDRRPAPARPAARCGTDRRSPSARTARHRAPWRSSARCASAPGVDRGSHRSAARRTCCAPRRGWP